MSIGVSPANAKFLDMLRDGYAEQYITISTSSSGDVWAHFEIEGEVADWISFEPAEERFLMSNSEPYRVKLIATPPADAAVGSYSGKITYVTDALATVGGGMGSAVRAAVISTLTVGITDKQIMACRGGGFGLSDTEVGYPIDFTATINNDGNVRFKPVFILEFWDQSEERIVMSRQLVGEEVLPTTSRSYSFQIQHNLEPGQYWVNIVARSPNENEVNCYITDILTMSVFERGEIVDQGVLKGVSGKVWAFVGEIIPIKATFQNTGERSVEAKFKGNVILDEQIVELLESESLRVQPDETVDFTTYFTPKEAGRYIVSGRVLYNSKLTFEKSTIINVNYPSGLQGLNMIPILLYVLILGIILFLFYKIRKEKNSPR
ncbi:hypothetical protein KY320_00905 [Candidatus Woesearchaeota archaeon]|nr:hypothetical protein [Candidatus Woesearchaeota archaeon]